MFQKGSTGTKQRQIKTNRDKIETDRPADRDEQKQIVMDLIDRFLWFSFLFFFLAKAFRTEADRNRERIERDRQRDKDEQKQPVIE